MARLASYIIAAITLVFSSISFAAEKPNFIVIFTDDQGYQDLGCYGSENIKTPRIDQMAREGMRFTSFYAQTVCGPSRAALMTGCYPLRVATKENRVEVHPRLHTKEITIAEVLKEAGYTSGVFGKWDLAGHSQTKFEQELLPTFQGFDTFFGTPASNDKRVNLMRGTKMIEKDADMSLLTQRLTDEAIGFIKKNKDKPFFVYLPHPMPHIRLEASEKFKGKSAGGIYGDVIEEIDFNVGRILDTLKTEGLDDNTYVFFTSDNGPWYLGRSKPHLKRIGPDAEKHGGLALPLRGAKTSTWEGGLRVPFIVRAPGKVPANQVSHEIACTMDLLPTLARITGGKVPDDRVIDGQDISSIIHDTPVKPGLKRQARSFFYYQQTRLQAVRHGKWKLHLPGPRLWPQYSKVADAKTLATPELYDLEADLSESTNIAMKHPQIVAQLTNLANQAREDIGDFNRIGKQARFFDPQPRRADIKRLKSKNNAKK